MAGVAPELLSGQAEGYAGDVSVEEAWRVLKEDPAAKLIDVRTKAEWTFVGIPDLEGIGQELTCLEWQMAPTMQVNPDFTEALSGALKEAGKDVNLFFLCRSGARSRAAAEAMTKAGFTACHNVAGGFEGDLDEARHRGRKNGWKAADLPWRQS